jgi:hypothetical protein
VVVCKRCCGGTADGQLELSYGGCDDTEEPYREYTDEEGAA